MTGGRSRTPRRIAVAAAVGVLLVNGCSSGTGSDAVSHPTHATPTEDVSAPPPPGTPTTGHHSRRGPLTLLPLECTRDALRVRLDSPMDAATGERSLNYAVWNVGSTACTLMGFPQVRLSDQTGAVLPFRYGRARVVQGTRRPAGPFVVRPSHRVFFQVDGYRCDVSRGRPAITGRVRLPLVSGSFAMSARGRGRLAQGVDFCGPGDPPSRLMVSRLGASMSGRDTPGNHIRPVPHPVVNMRGQLWLTKRSRRPSYGFGDLNGDGKRDLVVVRPTGLVSAHISGLGRRTVRLLPDFTLRLQGSAPLTGTGRDQVLVATTTAGAGTGYRLFDWAAVVVTLVEGRLVVLRSGRGTPLRLRFDAGRGDVFAGLRCGPATIDQVSVVQSAEHTFIVTTTAFHVAGSLAKRVSRIIHSVRGTSHTALDLAATRCTGLDDRGWIR